MCCDFYGCYTLAKNWKEQEIDRSLKERFILAIQKSMEELFLKF